MLAGVDLEGEVASVGVEEGEKQGSSEYSTGQFMSNARNKRKSCPCIGLVRTSAHISSVGQ